MFTGFKHHPGCADKRLSSQFISQRTRHTVSHASVSHGFDKSIDKCRAAAADAVCGRIDMVFDYGDFASRSEKSTFSKALSIGINATD